MHRHHSQAKQHASMESPHGAKPSQVVNSSGPRAAERANLDFLPMKQPAHSTKLLKIPAVKR